MRFQSLFLGLVCWCLVSGSVFAQPERLLYFPDSGRAFAQLDPGDELLDRNVLITNLEANYNVSFNLSYDQQNWTGFALGPRYSSFFSLRGREGCYLRIRTQLSEEQTTELLYFLQRGRCYSVYWNKTAQRWDVLQNQCRRY